MTSIAIIPVKRFGRALRRLAGILNRDERAALQEAMLTDLLTACRACPELDAVVVVTNDPHARSVADRFGADAVTDHDPPRGMNAAVHIGQRRALEQGFTVGLVLTADLPLVVPDDLRELLVAASPGHIVMSPAHDRVGTNALVMNPPDAIRTRLGPDSWAEHRRAADDAGLVVVERRLQRVGIDIDTPAELAALIEWPTDTVAARVCRELGIDQRLAPVAGG